MAGLGEMSEGQEEVDAPKEPLEGLLLKWTNYIQGWQSRWVVGRNGALSYYRSEVDQPFDCRGLLCLHKADVMTHDLDQCRFDVALHDHTWYFRAPSPRLKEQWVTGLRGMKTVSPCTSCDYLSKSENPSLSDLLPPSPHADKLHRDLKERVFELITHQGILKNQIEHLQEYFDFFAEHDSTDFTTLKEDLSKPELKKEAFSFKITSAATIMSLQKSIETLTKIVEFNAGGLHDQSNSNYKKEPDKEECPHSMIQEDEFFDAIELGLQRIEEEASLRELLKKNSIRELPPMLGDASEHPLWPEITAVTQEQIRDAQEDVAGEAWQAILDEGHMKMYLQERLVDGLVADPLRATYLVRGVTPRELCHYFFSPQYRQDWETTLEQMEVVEKISEDILVFHQVHKRVWPVAQRDSLFWSHRVRVEGGRWAVVNYSTSLPDRPQVYRDCLRIALKVCFYCERVSGGEEAVSRQDLVSRVRYCSTVNPGGWAPAFAVRTLLKREYPKFLKRFANYVINETKDKPIMN